MEPLDSQEPSFFSKLLHNKKLLIIMGGCAFVLVVVVPLVIGILLPSKASVPSSSSTKSKTTASGSLPAISPNPTVSNQQIPTITPQTGQSNLSYNVPTIDLDSLLPTVYMTPTPTPKPGPFYINNGKQNDLVYKLYLRRDWDLAYEVQLINTKTTEVRIIGYTPEASPGDSVYFSKDFSKVIFIGGPIDDYERLSIYSIPYQTIVKTVTLGDMKDALPALNITPTKVLSRLALSPDQTIAAFSYGNTYNVNLIEPDTYIIVINLTTNKMQLLPVKGLVNSWKDNTTVVYELNSSNPNVNTQNEVKISNF